MADKEYTAAVDLDGVLASWGEWKGWEHIGEPIPGALEFMEWLGSFCRITILTSRTCPTGSPTPRRLELVGTQIKLWLDKHGFPYDEIWIERSKPIANFYIDDRAVPCRPHYEKDPHEGFLKARNIITSRVAIGG